MGRINNNRVIRVLMSDKQECFIEGLSGIVHRVAGNNATVLAFTPKTNNEHDVFKTAMRHEWEFAILFLNNISYASGKREFGAIAEDSIDFVMKMAIVFDKPIFAIHGLSLAPWYHTRLLEAGATAAYQLPFDITGMEQAIRTYTGIR